MKAGWIGNPRLRSLVLAGEAILRPEIVTIVDSHLKDTRSAWEAGTASGAGTPEYLDAGGVRITAAPNSAVPATANDGSLDITALTHIPTSAVVLVTWIGGDPEMEIHNLVARLDPRRDGGQPKTVSIWRAQLFNVTAWSPTGGFSMAAISDPVDVAASGEVAANYTFTFQAPSGGRPKIGGGPSGATAVTRHPTTLIQITALRDTGLVADNVVWLSDAGQRSVTDGSTYEAAHYEIISSDDETFRALAVPAANVFPEFTLNAAAYTDPVILTFTSALQEFPNLAGSGPLVIRAAGERPSDSEITYAIWNGAAYVECFDGDVVGQDNTSQGGGDLSSVSTTGPWDVRVTLTPSTDELATPVVRMFGIERATSVWFTGAAEFHGGGRSIPDPVNLKGNIATCDLVIAKTGEQDFRDYGSNLLAENHIGAITVREWVADKPGSGQIDRPEWMLNGAWDLDDYVSTDKSHVLSLISPLRRLRNVIVPPFVVTSGNNGTRTATEVSGTIKASYASLVDGMVGLASRWRGPGPEDLNNVQKRLTRSEAKEEADRLAYLAGGAIIESQGRIRFVKVVRDGAGGDIPVAHFPLGSYDIGDVGPGYSTRTDEFFVPYDYSEGKDEFEAENRYFNGAAFTNLGGVGINTTQTLDEETAKWIVDSTLADLVGRRVPHHFATGLIVWNIVSNDRGVPHPELELGDTVTIETNRFVGRHPVNSGEVRGLVTALAIVIGVGDRWGRSLTLWVPSFDQIVVSTGQVTRRFPVYAEVEIHKDGTVRTIDGSEVSPGPEESIQAITVPAGYLAARGEVFAKYHLDVTSAVDFGASLRVRLNSVLIAAFAIPAATQFVWDLEVRVNNTAVGAQVAVATAILTQGANTFTRQARVTLTQDSAADMTLDLTVDWASTDASDIATLDYSLATTKRRD